MSARAGAGAAAKAATASVTAMMRDIDTSDGKKGIARGAVYRSPAKQQRKLSPDSCDAGARSAGRGVRRRRVSPVGGGRDRGRRGRGRRGGRGGLRGRWCRRG